MKIFLFFITFLCLYTINFSQNFDSLSIAQMYSELDVNKISTGFLYDKVIPFSGLSKFTGKDSIKSSTYMIWEQAYFEIEKSCVIENNVPSYNDIYKKANELYNGKNIFPIAFIDIKYNKIKDNAIEDGFLIFEDGKFYNVTDKTESPYLEKRTFLSTILTQKSLNYPENNFIIYEDFYISNDNNIKIEALLLKNVGNKF